MSKALRQLEYHLNKPTIPSSINFLLHQRFLKIPVELWTISQSLSINHHKESFFSTISLKSSQNQSLQLNEGFLGVFAKELTSAYDTLMDPKRRAALDQATAGAYAGATGFNSYTGGFPNQSPLGCPKRRNGKEIGEVFCCDGKFLVVFFVLGRLFLVDKQERINGKKRETRRIFVWSKLKTGEAFSGRGWDLAGGAVYSVN